MFNRLDHALIRVLSTCSVDCVIDVGANTGQFARLLRRQCGWSGPIRSFEPNPASFDELARVMSGDPDWQGFPLALGSNPGPAELRHHPNASEFDSLLPVNDYGRRRFSVLSERPSRQTVTVQRLDAVLAGAVPRTSNRILLKADTQGFDLEVLRGATGCMHRIVSVQVELSALEIYEGMTSLGEAIEEITRLGFDPVGLFAISRDGLRVVEFDGLFVRSDHNGSQVPETPQGRRSVRGLASQS